MQVHEEALWRYFTNRPCPTCHQQQVPEAVLVLVRRSRAWIVLVTCGHCRQRRLLMLTLSKASQRSQPAVGSSSAISHRDVREMRLFLASFNGDFLSLFGHGQQGHFAAE
jgi:hypothetical protein